MGSLVRLWFFGMLPFCHAKHNTGLEVQVKFKLVQSSIIGTTVLA